MGKLTFEDKLNIYYEKNKEIYVIFNKYNIDTAGIKYLIRLIDKHGFDILKTNKNRKFSKYEKERIINRILLNNKSLISVSLMREY